MKKDCRKKMLIVGASGGISNVVRYAIGKNS
jgi:hypothetical protein